MGLDAVAVKLAAVQPTATYTLAKSKNKIQPTGQVSSSFFLSYLAYLSNFSSYNERHTFPERSSSTLSDQLITPGFISKQLVGQST